MSIDFAVAGDDAGLLIRWGVHPSPWGDAFIAVAGDRVCALHFLDPLTASGAYQSVRRRWPGAEVADDPEGTAIVAHRIFDEDDVVPVLVRGTPFQVAVWRALCHVPAGRVATYDEIARAVGAPTAHRAVGAAVGRNPIALLVPCHRAVHKDGSIGGYRWGPDRKRALLAREAAAAGRPLTTARIDRGAQLELAAQLDAAAPLIY
jgi:AraC family transcriptional regulator, regulatory protein of adaptative response / methylated-DNA-[protein]-cysteine methyltransferase